MRTGDKNMKRYYEMRLSEKAEFVYNNSEFEIWQDEETLIYQVRLGIRDVWIETVSEQEVNEFLESFYYEELEEEE